MKLNFKILKGIPLFSKLTEKELKKVAKIIKYRRVKKGKKLIHEESKGSLFYLVLSGKVKIFQTGSGGKRKTLAILEKGDFFGEMSLIDKEIRSASAEVLEDSELLIVSEREFHKIIMKDNRILIKITQVLVRRLREADKEIKALTFQNILERLIWKLIEISKLRKTKKLQLSLRELEEMVGSSREVISRALSRLIRLKLIARGENKIILKNVKGLKNLVNF